MEVPPIGPVLGVAQHLHNCPLCGGPNPFHKPAATTVRTPKIDPFRQKISMPPPLTAAEIASFLPPPATDLVPRQAPPPPAEKVLTPEEAKRDHEIIDHPIVGGRVTVFVLCYGNHFDLARRCLDSILSSVPERRLDLRIGLNEVCPETEAYVSRLPASKIYRRQRDTVKYPMMREMFHDPAHPITTRYVVWFDDDSYVVDKNWLARLSESIVANHPGGARLYGIRFVHDIAGYAKGGHDPARWFREATWWKNRPFVQRNGTTPAPNASHAPFVAGGFWALATSVIKEADIPDVRLWHNGGDITLGLQVYQAGHKLKDFNRGKIHVHSSGAPRRGYSEKFPWAGPAARR